MIPPGRSSVKENIEGTADPAFSVYKPLTLNCILYTIKRTKGRDEYVLWRTGPETGHVTGVLRDHGLCGLLLQEAFHGRERLCAGRAQRRPLADGFCLRDELFFRGGVRRLRRAVRLAVRHRLHLDRYRERVPGIPAGLVGAGAPHPDHDAAPEVQNHAAVL